MALRGGHPWLFEESVRDQNREGDFGELAVIYDRKDQFLAVGLFDPESPLRLRVLHCGKPQAIDDGWWRARLESALVRRHGLFDENTTGHRWINGESDGWPGLVLDRYGSTLVLKIYTASWFAWLENLVALIKTRLVPDRLVLRLSRNIQAIAASRFQKSDGQILHGSPLAGPVLFKENGLSFESEVIKGQKTGFFLDQRENRKRVQSLANGRQVLNAFSFSGGFSIYAASGGASSVTDLDISAHALGGGERNFGLNAGVVAECRREKVQADAFQWIGGTKRRFGLMITDPPSLARRESERPGAIIAYESLASMSIERLQAGGVLVACSCSAHVSRDEFFSAVRKASLRSGRKFSEIETAGHAPDHPATFKAAEYLKAIYLSFQ